MIHNSSLLLLSEYIEYDLAWKFKLLRKQLVYLEIS